MLAGITDGRGKVWCDHIPMPEPGDYECLCRIETCATCTGTDKKLIRGQMTWALPESYPAVLGHESCGVVERVGAKVRHIAPGDRFLRPAAWYSGEVRHGLTSWMGGMAEYGVVTDLEALAADHPEIQPSAYAKYQQRIPRDVEISAVDATMLITLKEISSFIRDLHIRSGSRILIMGAGSVGLAMCFFAKLAGASVAVTARRESQLAAAHSAGADFAVDSTDPAMSLKVRDWSGEGVQYLLDAAGDSRLLTSCVPALAVNGVLCPYASNPGIRQEMKKLAVSSHGSVSEISPTEVTAHESLLELVRQNAIPFRLFYTEILPVSDVTAGFDRIFNRQSLKTVFTMGR